MKISTLKIVWPLVVVLLYAAVAQAQERHPNAGAGGGKRSWGSEQATGAPDTPREGDIQTAWASLLPDGGLEWLKVDFERAVNIAEVRIRETFNPGAITKVAAVAQDGKEHLLWEGEDPTTEAPDDFVVQVEDNIEAKSIKIYLDTKRRPGWNEIDAVELVAKDGARQWAAHATASSTYADRIQTPLARSIAPDIFAELYQRNLRVYLEGNNAFDGTLLRSDPGFLVFKDLYSDNVIIVNKAKVIYLRVIGETTIRSRQ